MLDTLYKRNANGTINTWKVIVEGSTYWTEFGQLNGSIIKTEPITALPKNIGKKNETTALEQANKEALSLWNKKIKKENFVTDISNIDNILFNPPMLASIYNKYTPIIKYCQPKLDGIRCNISYSNGNVKAISRKNSEFYTVNHIIENLQEILKKNPSIHLDGELYNHKLHDDFNMIVSLVKKTNLTENDIVNVTNYVRYNVYDMWDDNRPNLSFKERNEIINNLLNDVEYVDIVETYEINNEDDVETYFNKFINDGYEGEILRLDNPYEHKRSKNLLKYKKFNEDEFLILDICEGKIKGYAEYAWIKLHDGNKCKATLSFNYNMCKKILNEKNDIIGKYATVKFFGYTKDKKLRFPIFKSIRDYE